MSMKVNRQFFSSIRNVLIKCAASVPANKTWMQLHTELALGVLKGNKILLSKDDRDRLRQFVINDTGIDPMAGDISGDRLTLAGKTANEKLSSQAVFGNEIKLFRNNLAIKLSGGAAITPPGAYLSAAVDNIDVNDFGKIIVVENGSVFKNWSKTVLTDDLFEALVIYRGHDTGARVVLEFLRQRTGDLQIYAAVDFDPQGFRIALDLHADAILIPEQYEALRLEANINKDLEFDKQSDKKCASIMPANWKKVWDWMHDSRTAITQEAILVRNWPLRALYK